MSSSSAVVGELVDVCSALADDSRWQILQMLGDRPLSASELASELPISRQAIARHLGVLEGVGLVEASRHGRQLRYQALGARLSHVAQHLQRIGDAWDARLDRLRVIAEEAAGREGA